MLKCKHVFLILCIFLKELRKIPELGNLRFVREIGSNHTISTIISIFFSNRNIIRLSQRNASNFLLCMKTICVSPSKCINSDGMGRFQVNVVLYFLNTQSFSGRNVRNLLRNKFLKLFCWPVPSMWQQTIRIMQLYICIDGTEQTNLGAQFTHLKLIVLSYNSSYLFFCSIFLFLFRFFFAFYLETTFYAFCLYLFLLKRVVF